MLTAVVVVIRLANMRNGVTELILHTWSGMCSLDASHSEMLLCDAGVHVLTTKLDQHGHVVPDEVIFHQGFIANTCADAPMRAKILYFVGSFLAYLVCVYCRLCGVRRAGTMRYVGYVAPVTADRGQGAGGSFQMGRQHDDGEQRHCCMMAIMWAVYDLK